MKNYDVLSIDAWAGDEESSWDWNSWHKVGSIEIDINGEESRIIEAMIYEGYISGKARGKVELEDDQYNLVIVNKETREPLYAIEYGADA
jgi:hypothetical protein